MTKVEEVRLWGVPFRTNMEALAKYARTDTGPEDKFLLPLMMEVFEVVEMNDLLVKRAFAVLRGKTLYAGASPDKGFTILSHGRIFLREVELSECAYCENTLYDGYDRESTPESQIRFHRPECPTVLALEVMTG